MNENRIIAAVIFALCLGLLAMGTYLTPSYGLTEAFGVPICGVKLHTGYPCWTCGMTTAFTYATHGNLVMAFKTQIFGAVLAVASAAFLLISGWSLLTGMSMGPIGRIVGSKKVVIGLVALFIGAWLVNMWVAHQHLHGLG